MTLDIAAIKARAEAGEWYYHHEVMALIAALEASEAARVKAEQALWELDAVGCDFGYYEQAAKTMKSIVDKAIDGLLKQPSILTSTEQKAQGKRCSCGGADDYCVCQNSPDKTTISKRITVLEQERDALKEALKSRDEANAAIHNQEPER